MIASGSQAYGFYPEMENDRTIWRGHFASALLDSNGKKVGVLVRIASIQSLVDALRTMRTRMTLIFAAALLVVALAIVMITRLMTRPIHELSEGIRSMGEGDFTRRVRVKGRDELAQLAAAFNKMEDQVQSLDETRNQFVSNASHELKTPLATMKILLESILYSDNLDRATQNEFLSDINKEIDRLTSVVSDLLTLAHIDSKKLTLKREELYLSDVVRESVERLMPMAANRKQTINVSIEDECEMVADESKLEQVCYNLIGNAVKYALTGTHIFLEIYGQ